MYTEMLEHKSAPDGVSLKILLESRAGFVRH